MTRNYIILPMKININNAPECFTNFIKSVDAKCNELSTDEIYSLVISNCNETDFDVGSVFDNIDDYHENLNLLIKLIPESEKISKYDIFYDYLVNNYKYKDFVFQTICEKLEKHRDNIIADFLRYLNFNDENEMELFMNVLHNWFDSLNKRDGIFSMDINCLLNDEISFTDTSPRSVILDMFFKIKKETVIKKDTIL